MKEKKYLFILMTIMMIAVLALAGCGAAKQDEGGAEGQPAEESEEQSEEQAGMANPWSDAKSAEEAGKGANVGDFKVEGIKTSLGVTGKAPECTPVAYRYMKGMAEAEFGIAAVEMTIRKADSGQVDFGDSDCSGDYNEYKHQWTQKASTKTVWYDGKYSYSIMAIGAGGDDDYGLSKKDVKALVSALSEPAE